MKEKIKVTAQQRANAIEARDVMWPSVPSENVATWLVSWRTDSTHEVPTCGTVACFGGWCAWWPSFQAQGVQACEHTGAPKLFGKSCSHRDASNELFGTEDMLFPRGTHTADIGFSGTDHMLVTTRLNWLIKNSVVVE